MIHFLENYTFYSMFLPSHLILRYDQICPSLEAAHFLKDLCVRLFPLTYYQQGAMFRSLCVSSGWWRSPPSSSLLCASHFRKKKSVWNTKKIVLNSNSINTTFLYKVQCRNEEFRSKSRTHYSKPQESRL